VGLIFASALMPAEQVPVRHNEGRLHGFLVLRDLESKLLASGSLVQQSSGNRVTAELTFNFKDGSLHKETSVFTQRRVFQLLTHRLVQKGPTFKRQVDMSLDVSSGKVDVRYSDDDGQPKTISEKMELPADLSNGIVPTLMSDIDPKAPRTTVSMLVTTPKPRVVKLEISPLGEDSFSIGETAVKAMRFAVKVEIGGIGGAIAPIFGKQPPDTQIWVVGGKAPGFVKSEGPMCQDCPLWRIELASPVWPSVASRRKR
jgi:hypothetical protein